MEDQFLDRLTKNLEAIAHHSPLLAKRICWSIETDHLRLEEGGQTYYKLHTTWLPYSATEEQINSSISENDNIYFLFGISHGEYLDYIFSENKDAKIIVWERDPALLRQVLSYKDYSKAIYEKRLKLLLNADLFSKHSILHLTDPIYHPFFSQIYYQEKRFLESSRNRPVAAVGLGGLFVDDLCAALDAFGYTVWPLNLTGWSKEELQYNLSTLNPKFLASINYTNGTAEFCNQFLTPFLCWEIDPSMDALPPYLSSPSPDSYIFSYRKKNIQTYLDAGFQNVFHLPLASNTQKRKPTIPSEDSTQYTVPVAFVGTSMVEEAQQYRKVFIDLYNQYAISKNVDSEYGESFLQAILDQQFNEDSRYIVPSLYQEYFSDFSTYLTAKKINIHAEKIIGQIAAAERRLRFIASLGDLSINVWGDNGWKTTENYGAVYRGEAGHHYELTQIYANATINIDINRIYQLDIVTMRIFDVLACGGFIIAEYSDELCELFIIGREIESYKTLEELRDKIIYYSKNHKQRTTIATKGMQTVNTRHSFASRVQTMLEIANFHKYTRMV